MLLSNGELTKTQVESHKHIDMRTYLLLIRTYVYTHILCTYVDVHAGK